MKIYLKSQPSTVNRQPSTVNRQRYFQVKLLYFLPPNLTGIIQTPFVE
ncbi:MULTISPECIES: hypothetical protein [Calothrix]|uniref:Transposase n=2 Tax=Calothrix TaxID=1186 RepID=A0ABR8A5R6_9CYAN|nr:MULTISPECIES: hypothetical protein [Calothrix]MBD2195335.1 hypothetical protein [Calothrix parietina FACHB-288]MBD2223934.1 hypothetical protein [Calothrix anomala FACHB-343]